MNSLKINIIDNKIIPSTFATDAISYPIGYLKYAINKALTAQKLPSNFIIEAYLDIQIEGNKITCSSHVRDLNNNEYFYKSLIK